MTHFLIGLFLSLVTFLHVSLPQKPVAKITQTVTIPVVSPSPKPMKLLSPAFVNNETLPEKYTCNGKGVNPPLDLQDVPATASSMVLIMDDPDAPSGVYTHWLVFNIPPTTKTITEGVAPEGSVVGTNSSGHTNYAPACPPAGTGAHRYRFTLYMLNTVIVLLSNARVADIENAMQGHVIASSQLIGLYPGN